MTINTIGPEGIAQRKAVSDAKNDTDDLTFDGASKGSRGLAYKAVREYNDNKELTRLFDEAYYYEELLNDV